MGPASAGMTCGVWERLIEVDVEIFRKHASTRKRAAVFTLHPPTQLAVIFVMASPQPTELLRELTHPRVRERCGVTSRGC